MTFSLAMNYPPLKLKSRGAINVKWHIAHFAHAAVKIYEVRKRLFVFLPVVPVLEHESGSGSLIRDRVRSYEGQVVLRSEQFRHLVVQFETLATVIGFPHRGFEPRHFVRVEAAHL